jgi:hypothetical protein
MSATPNQGAQGWHKSSYSTAQEACIEQGVLPTGKVAIRDTKLDGAGPVLAINPTQWQALLDTIR